MLFARRTVSWRCVASAAAAAAPLTRSAVAATASSLTARSATALPRAPILQLRAALSTSTIARSAAPVPPASTSAPAAPVVSPAPAAAEAATVAPVADAAAAAAPAATVAAGPAVPSRADRFRRFVEDNRVKWTNFALLAGGAGACYFVAQGGLQLTGFFVEHRPHDAPFVAFLLGAGVAVACGLVYRLGRKLFLLRAARSYRQLLRTVFASPEVRERLGEDVRKVTLARMQRFGRNHAWEAVGNPSAAAAVTSAAVASPAKKMVSANLRLVSFLPQGFALRRHRDAWARYWRSRRLHFIVAVHGSGPAASATSSDGSSSASSSTAAAATGTGPTVTGLVCAEIEQSLRGEDQTNVLTVELVQQGEQIVLTPRTPAEAEGAANKKTTKMQHSLLDAQEQRTGTTRGKDLLSRKVDKY